MPVVCTIHYNYRSFLFFSKYDPGCGFFFLRTNQCLNASVKTFQLQSSLCTDNDNTNLHKQWVCCLFMTRQTHSRLSIQCTGSKACHPSNITCKHSSTQINAITSLLQSIQLLVLGSAWNYRQWRTSKHATITLIFSVPTPTVSTDDITTVPSDQEWQAYVYLIPHHNLWHSDTDPSMLPSKKTP